MAEYNIIGELLLREGLLDCSALDRALLEIQSKAGVSLGKALDELGLAEESAVTSAIARGLHLDSLGSEFPMITPEVDALLPVDKRVYWLGTGEARIPARDSHRYQHARHGRHDYGKGTARRCDYTRHCHPDADLGKQRRE
jgi:hypothetical protein